MVGEVFARKAMSSFGSDVENPSSHFLQKKSLQSVIIVTFSSLAIF